MDRVGELLGRRRDRRSWSPSRGCRRTGLRPATWRSRRGCRRAPGSSLPASWPARSPIRRRRRIPLPSRGRCTAVPERRTSATPRRSCRAVRPRSHGTRAAPRPPRRRSSARRPLARRRRTATRPCRRVHRRNDPRCPARPRRPPRRRRDAVALQPGVGGGVFAVGERVEEMTVELRDSRVVEAPHHRQITGLVRRDLQLVLTGDAYVHPSTCHSAYGHGSFTSLIMVGRSDFSLRYGPSKGKRSTGKLPWRCSFRMPGRRRSFAGTIVLPAIALVLAMAAGPSRALLGVNPPITNADTVRRLDALLQRSHFSTPYSAVTPWRFGWYRIWPVPAFFGLLPTASRPDFPQSRGEAQFSARPGDFAANRQMDISPNRNVGKALGQCVGGNSPAVRGA